MAVGQTDTAEIDNLGNLSLKLSYQVIKDCGKWQAGPQKAFWLGVCYVKHEWLERLTH